MRLSTSTNIMDRYNNVQNTVSMEECVVKCAEAGYEVLDMNFCDMSNAGMPLAKDNWQEWVESIGSLAAEHGIEFSQSHTDFYNVISDKVENVEWREELVRRAIIGSGMLGVKWVVFHAGNYIGPWYSAEISREKNIKYFKPHIELAKANGTGIAIENMVEGIGRNARRYTATTGELIDLVDTINDPSVGICWDFGHAHLNGIDQAEALRRIGSRLVATHVADNHGDKDDHVMPYLGSIDWEPLMKVLKEIDYKYDFTYEIHNYLGRVPLELRETGLKYSYEVGMYLLSLAEQK